MQQGVSSCSSFMFIWFRKRRTSAKCDSSPSRKRDCFRWTNSSNLWCVFKSQWAAITSQISWKALQCFPHIVTLLQWKLFALHFHVKISQASLGSLGQSVKNTYPVYTLSFYKTVFFFRPSKAIPIKCFVSYRPPSREGGSVNTWLNIKS